MAMTLDELESLRDEVLETIGSECSSGAYNAVSTAFDRAEAHLSAQAQVPDDTVDMIAKMVADRVGNGMCEKYIDLAYRILEMLPSRLSQGASEESDLHVIMERNAWRAAMIGLCVPTREVDVATPELASEHLRKRLSQGAQGEADDSAIGYRGDVCDHGRGMDETCQEYPCWRDYTHPAERASVTDSLARHRCHHFGYMVADKAGAWVKLSDVHAMLAAPQPPEGVRVDDMVTIPRELAENFLKSTNVPRFRRILEQAISAPTLAGKEG